VRSLWLHRFRGPLDGEVPEPAAKLEGGVAGCHLAGKLADADADSGVGLKERATAAT
jgi:hypothetical protein